MQIYGKCSLSYAHTDENVHKCLHVFMYIVCVLVMCVLTNGSHFVYVSNANAYLIETFVAVVLLSSRHVLRAFQTYDTHKPHINKICIHFKLKTLDNDV